MKLSTVFAFLIGAVAGAAAVYYYEEKRYQNFYEEEIGPVKESLTKMIEKMKKEAEPKKENEVNQKNVSKPKETDSIQIDKYKKEASSYKNYSNSSAIMVDEDEEVPPPPKEYFGDPNAKPVIITPEEFGDDEEYEKISLFYYTDGVICDDSDEPLSDEEINRSIGLDAKNHFGEYEEDCVYIRNDRLKTYYELLISLKSYSEDVLPNKSFLAGDGDVL